MSKEIDYDNMSDEQIDEILSQIDSGTFENSEPENGNDFDQNEDDNNSNSNSFNEEEEEEDENLNNGNLEDTENGQSEDGNADTNANNDDLKQDTASGSNGENSENSQVENSNTNANQNADTANPEDAKGSETGKIDPAEYEKLKKFYDEIANAEFVANGKKVKGFTDPSKIIRSQQMLHDYSNKMRGINEYKPYLKTLKDKGIIGNEEKFNFAMSLLDGDKATIKKHLESLKIDPVDLELDDDANAQYSPRNYMPSKESLVLDEAMDIARSSGVEDKLRTVIAKEWDEESFGEFLRDPRVRNDLITHMQDGSFDTIQNKMTEMEMLDLTGSFRGLKSTDKYRAAIAEINREIQYQYNRQSVNPSIPQQEQYYRSAPTGQNQYQPNAEAERLALAAKEAEYKAMAEKKLRDDEARKRAAMITKKKSVTVTQKKFDPLALEGDDLDNFVNELIAGKK